MKLLILSQYFYPENFRINDIVKEMVKRGHDITVLTGLPNYPNGEVFEGYEDSYKHLQNYYGAKIYRCKLRPRKKGIFNLALNYASFIIQSKKVLRRINPNFDIVFFYEPSPISSGIPAIWYGKKHKIKTVMYNLDIWPDCVRDLPNGKVMSKNNPIFLFAKVISKYVYNNFDLILNKCDEFKDYLHSMLKIDKNKMITCFEHAEEIYLSVNEKPLNNGCIDYMFLGNIGKAQNCDLIVKAFNKIDKTNKKLHFVGDGSYLNSLKELVRKLRLEEYVIFHGRCTIEETINYYNIADVCLLTLSNQTASGLTPPTKLTGYMASSRPIIGAISGAAKTIITSAKCGYICEPNDIDGLSRLMNTAYEERQELINMGANARKYFLENFTLDKFINNFELFLYRIEDKYE